MTTYRCLSEFAIATVVLAVPVAPRFDVSANDAKRLSFYHTHTRERLDIRLRSHRHRSRAEPVAVPVLFAEHSA
jgi:hypothetical protein